MELKTIRLDLIDPNPNQPRESLGDLTTLVDSISKRGVLVPILVMESGTRYLTIAGHRRTSAARIAGEEDIPAIIAANWDEADRLIATMAENTVRLDMTALEIAAGYQTLLDLKVDPDDIAKSTGGMSAQAVTAAARVFPSLIGTDKYDQVTIPQMVALNEFEGDKKSTKALLAAIETGRNFDYEVERVREARAHKEKLDAATAELEAAGIRVIPMPNYMPGGARSLEDDANLYGTPEEHASCPGHCAYLDYNANTRYACDQPALHGGQDEINEARKIEREKEDQERAERKTAWTASAKVRLEFVKTQVGSPMTAAGLLEWAVSEAEKRDLSRSRIQRAEFFGELRSPVDRLIALAIAQIEFEEYGNTLAGLYMAPGYCSTTVHAGSALYTRHVAYLVTLTKLGYTLTPPETMFLESVAAFIEAEKAEEVLLEAARIAIDCSACSENEANGGDCAPEEDGHPSIDGLEANEEGTVDSCFYAIDTTPDDDTSVDADAGGAHEGEIGTPSTNAPEPGEVVSLADVTGEALTAEANPFADSRISLEFAKDDADRMIEELATGKVVSLMHWSGSEVYAINIVNGQQVAFIAHVDRPIGAAIADARLFANRYAEAHSLKTDDLTVEGSTITLTFTAGE